MLTEFIIFMGSSITRRSKRHEWKAAHGYRKFYKSRAEQVMKPINVSVDSKEDLK
jgi:hypothetical protein